MEHTSEHPHSDEEHDSQPPLLPLNLEGGAGSAEYAEEMQFDSRVVKTVRNLKRIK
jgi:hypothetical protein